MSDAAGLSALPRAVVSSAFNRRSSGEQVATYIRSLIFHGHLRQGERIRQDELAATLGVSRIPVREAIIALDREGWVTSEPHRGAFVNGFDRASLADHYEMLGLLYGLTARRATERASDETLAKLPPLLKSLQGASTAEDIEFFNGKLIRSMFGAAASSRLSAVGRVMTPVVPGNFFEAIPGAIDDQKKGIARVVKAIVSRDAEKAAQEWLKLLRRQGEHVADLLTASKLFKDS
jgi:DNA-binding GntR family transcriptional regulator